jgi:hypothetical protein
LPCTLIVSITAAPPGRRALRKNSGSRIHCNRRQPLKGTAVNDNIENTRRPIGCEIMFSDIELTLVVAGRVVLGE